MKLSTFALPLLLTFCGIALTAGETIFKETVGLCSKLSIPISPDYLTLEELKNGEVTLFATASNKTAGWTIHGKYDSAKNVKNLYLTDGENETGLDPQPTADHFGVIGSGVPLKLHFKLPPKAADNGVELIISKGIFGMGHAPEGPFTFEVWKGVRLTEPKVTAKVDKLRNYVVTVQAGGEGLKYKYEVENGRTSETTSTTFRGRIPAGQDKVKLKVTVSAPDGTSQVKEVEVLAPQSEESESTAR